MLVGVVYSIFQHCVSFFDQYNKLFLSDRVCIITTPDTLAVKIYFPPLFSLEFFFTVCRLQASRLWLGPHVIHPYLILPGFAVI